MKVAHFRPEQMVHFHPELLAHFHPEMVAHFIRYLHPNNKPVVYKIQTEGGNNNYTGVAKRGRVNERIKEHLGEIPGASVQIEQVSSIDEALKKESNIISRSKPKYNIKGK